ncbi:MAG: hypothetical protein ACXWCZ_09580, partial [Flavisolibacter sp.]
KNRKSGSDPVMRGITVIITPCRSLENEGIHVIAYEDEASRKILLIGEFNNATTDNALEVLNSSNEFKDWYDNRIHGYLELEWGEIPNEAFIRKMRPESILGRFFKAFGW